MSSLRFSILSFVFVVDPPRKFSDVIFVALELDPETDFWTFSILSMFTGTASS